MVATLPLVFDFSLQKNQNSQVKVWQLLVSTSKSSGQACTKYTPDRKILKFMNG